MILRTEELSMNAWPSLQTNFYDGWVLRFSNGYTKRANSINPIYASTIDVNCKIKMCEDIYCAKGLPVVYKMTKESCPGNLESILDAQGYVKKDETSVRVLNLSDFENINNIQGVELEFKFTKEWLEAFALNNNIKDKFAIATMKQLLGNITGEKICAYVVENNEISACGFGVIEDNFIGLFDILVKEDKRGKGYGKAIMQGILKEAQRRNVKNAYLQVIVGNKIAENLYDSLGFKEIYRYWYRIKNMI